jgi:predicted TIM-barrel fold metal-dependent hydrolase
VPHIEKNSTGGDCWVVDGHDLGFDGVADCGAIMRDRTKNPQRWSEVPPSVYDPKERLEVMDAAGVAYSVLYPTVAGSGGQNFGRIEDPELELACVQAYNDWLLEEWASASDRFIPQCITPLFPIDAAVNEIRRAVKNGHRGVIYPAVPMELRAVPHINDSIYDPLWATCQELAVPICFHAGASSAIQIPAYEGYSPTIAAAFQAITRPASTVSVLVNLLISKILMRFPNLKVVLAESGLGWGAYLLEYTDFQATGDQLPRNGYDLMPSEMFKRQCYLVGWYDQASLRVRQYIGIENILWSAQFPLATSTWPNTQEALARSFDGVAADDRQKILWENAAKLYKIPFP